MSIINNAKSNVNILRFITIGFFRNISPEVLIRTVRKLSLNAIMLSKTLGAVMKNKKVLQDAMCLIAVFGALFLCAAAYKRQSRQHQRHIRFRNARKPCRRICRFLHIRHIARFFDIALRHGFGAIPANRVFYRKKHMAVRSDIFRA